VCACGCGEVVVGISSWNNGQAVRLPAFHRHLKMPPSFHGVQMNDLIANPPAAAMVDAEGNVVGQVLVLLLLRLLLLLSIVTAAAISHTRR
jgi:hypothetical protein